VNDFADIKNEGGTWDSYLGHIQDRIKNMEAQTRNNYEEAKLRRVANAVSKDYSSYDEALPKKERI
jgi:hypothetical protein